MNNITIGKFVICRSASPAPSNLFESFEPTTPASEKNVNQAELEDESILMPWEREVRLPRSVLPKHYDLYLHPNLQLGTFTGMLCTISILIQCRSYLSQAFFQHFCENSSAKKTQNLPFGQKLKPIFVQKLKLGAAFLDIRKKT